MRKVLGFASLAIVAFAASACTETASSSDIKTHGIRAAFDIYGGSVTKVQAELKVGSDSNTYVNLDNGDQLVATVGTETKNMTSTSEGHYEASFAAVAPETKITIDFKRPSDTSAPNNVGTLPAPFTLGTFPTTPPSRATEDIIVTWTPAGTDSDGFRLSLDGDCIYSWTKDMADTGTYTISKAELQSLDAKAPKSCTITVGAERYRSGTADPALASDSYVHSHQTATGTFQSAP
jgi:hypothetical protein